MYEVRPVAALRNSDETQIGQRVHFLKRNRTLKLNILSDLHLGFGAFDRPVNDADVVILAGDISRPREAAAWAMRFRKPVLYVLGNHEFYGSSIDGAADEL